MYQITNYNSGETVGYTEKPRYIKKNSSGIYVETDEEHAQGIAYKSIPYNLAHREGVGVDTTVILFQYDTGDVVIDQQKNNAVIGGQRAERRYEPGELITVDGELYRVKLPILVGSFITPGTNVEETDIASELSKLNLGGN